jgi:uncharacterized protein YdhG (YjbR/CyaY superfamily)
MVQSKAATVDDWMAEVEPARAPAIRRIRESALSHGWAEAMRYGMPACGPPGADPVFAFDSQKQYISLYVPPAVHALHAEALKGLDAGKSCIRFRNPAKIDFDLVDRLIADSARAGIEPGC